MHFSREVFLPLSFTILSHPAQKQQRWARMLCVKLWKQGANPISAVGLYSTSIAKKARPISTKAKRKASAGAKATELSGIGVFKADGVIVLKEKTAAQNAATGKAEEAALQANFVFEEEKAVQNAAIDRSEEVSFNAAANESNINAKKELSEWTAKLDLNTCTSGRRWEKTAYKLLDYGISSAHVKKMLPKCRKLWCRHSPDSTLKHLTMLGMSHEEMGCVISRWPNILNISNSAFQSKVELFESVGINPRFLGKVMPRIFRTMGLSLSTLRERCDFWKDYLQDVQENALHTLILRNPQILTYGLQKKVKPMIAYLEELGFSKKMMLRCYSILGVPLKLIAMKVKLLEQFGISNIYALAVFHSVSSLNLHKRLHNLLTLGFSFDQVQKMITDYPYVLAYTEDHINLKLRYAVNVMNLSLDMLVVCPVFLGCSYEKRIKYRFEVLQELKTLGAYDRNISLGYLVSMTDADFSRKFVKKLQACTKHSNI